MKKLLYIILSISLVSCKKDFLEKLPLDSVTPETFYKTPDDAIRAINAAYKPLQNRGVGQFGIDRLGNYTAQDTYGPTPYNLFSVTTDDEILLNSWTSLYQCIFRSNLVLTNVSNSEIDANLKNRILGEASFLRAFSYHYLVLLFGDVPLITKPLLKQDEFAVARTPKADVYKQIIEDLTFAEKNLPVKYGAADLGRVTQGAAKSYLAKVYLYQKRWAETAAKAEEVITSGTYKLFDRYFDNFEIATENGIESIFEIQYASFLGGQGSATNDYDAPRGSGFTPNGGYGNGSPSKEFVNSFAPNDPRLKYSVFMAGDSFQGVPYNPGTSPTGYSPRKYVVGKGPNIGMSDSPKNFVAMRYAELLLIYAEALNELGRTSEAYAPVNQIRGRKDVNLPTLPLGLTQEEMRKAIKDERRWELGLEGHRWFDLVRWGDAASYMRSIGITSFVEGKHEVFPIPQQEMDLNPLLTQNPGY